MVESGFVDRARHWVVENYPYNRDHLIRSLEWLDRLAPGLPEAVRLAALTHDMERAFPGPDSPARNRSTKASLNSNEYDFTGLVTSAPCP